MQRHGMILVAILALAGTLAADDTAKRALELELKGDVRGARSLLRNAADNPGAGADALEAYAAFLDRRGDPEARPAYDRLLKALPAAPSPRRAAAARRLVLLDLLAGDRAAAVRHLEVYRAAGGKDFASPPSGNRAASKEVEQRAVIEIPGPIASFSRMAALSPDLPPEDVLPALARNVVTNGYQASSGAESLEQTEFLKLVVRYLSQARELERLAGESKTIRIETCESPQTADLLRVLGYRMRGGCGSDVVLETVNASRAFLTIDSGFPLAELEQALRLNRPFVLPYAPALVPVLYGADYWLAGSKSSSPFIDQFLGDPSICRLYLGMSKLERDTANQLRETVPVQRIKAFAHVLDFFGGMFHIVEGRAVVPGAPRTLKAWEEMVGVAPDKGAAFFERLIARDDGWLASYFDSLARITDPRLRDYLTEPERMKTFYSALRGRITSPGPARPVFRSNTDLLLLTTRLRLNPQGRPHIPGGIEVWKNLFINHPHGKYDGKLTRLATSWKEPEDVLEALFALCRKAVENEPLKIFMALSDIDGRRKTPLEAATVDRLARSYRYYGAQYSLFNEVPSLSDKTILLFLDTAESIGRIRDQRLRADAAGTMQALAALWQIFTRNEAIAESEADAVLSGILIPFGKARNNRDLFDAGYDGVKLLLKAAGSPAGVSPQDRFLDLLAGAPSPSDQETHTQVVQDMIRIFEAQRLVSLQTIVELADHLDAIGRGEKLNAVLLNRLAARVAEIELPRSALSSAEKNAMAFGYYTERHIEDQRRLNLRREIERAGADAEKLRDLRGLLAPILRDTLVGFCYIHYAPPGAQVLYTNPLFVRSHDFLGVQGSPQTWRSTEVLGTGWPSSGGGRLVGSLAGLPYALAEAEQNFLIPTREQALIWGDLVPQMIVSAKVPRWWNVTPAQMHFVGLHLRLGQSLLAEGVLDADRRAAVLEAMAAQAPPARVRRAGQLLADGRLDEALVHVTPSELFTLAARSLESAKDSGDVLAAGIRALMAADPAGVSPERISRAFGTPKPTLANSYRPELLHLRTFPTLMGYSSRIMAESWESNGLYYAALADEMQLRPSQLNVLVPEWTQKTVESIFATHLEDWPALLRSLRKVGDAVKDEIRKQAAAQALRE